MCATSFNCLQENLAVVWNFTSVNLTEVTYTLPEALWTLHWNKICHNVKSQTRLSSLWVSCKHALIIEMQQKSKLNKSELHSANINNRLYSFFKDLIKLKRLHESNINLHNKNIVRGLEFLLCFTVIKVKIMAVRTILLTVKTNNKKII